MTEILVNKQSVKELLSTGIDSTFIIPDYQRPYSWTMDEAQTMFEDVWDFSLNEGGTKRDGTYFLGSIVTCENHHDQPHSQMIIDGQQRITTLLLLLRAIYTTLEQAHESQEVQHAKSEIGHCIWRYNRLTGQVDKESSVLESHAVNDRNQILAKILETGEVQSKASDNYSRNYSRLLNLYKEKCANDALHIFDFIFALINQVIVLPVKADKEETALTIFNTLNDRGLPLTDADIFKSHIYKTKASQAEKDKFINKWKELEEESKALDSSIQSYFTLEMYYLKARSDDRDPVVGLRKFFLNENRLNHPELLDDLSTFHKLNDIITRAEQSTENDILRPQTIQLLNILTSYTNDYWKYPVYIYFNKYHKQPNFIDNFDRFLRKLIVVLSVVWINAPSVNNIKHEILRLNCDIIKKQLPEFHFSKFNRESIATSNYITPHPRIIHVLLKTLAYYSPSNRDNRVLPPRWEIEHILPQKYENTYFENHSADTIKENITHLGNLVPIEKKLNIQASNGFFGKKKERYARSNIAITRELSNLSNTNWRLEDIKSRDEQIKKTLIDLFTRWNDEYESARTKR